MKKRILVLLLALVMVAGSALPAVASEGVSDEPVVAADEAAPAATDEETPAPTEEPTPTETPAPVEESAPASAEADALPAAVSVSDGEAPATTQDPVPYVDENGNAQTVNDYTVVTSDMTTLGAYGQTTWYVVKDNVTIADSAMPYRLNIQGDVNLILCDGATLTLQETAQPALDIGYSEYSLTIYGQAGQTGTLKVDYRESSYGGVAINTNGSLTVNGGVLEAAITDGYCPDSCCFSGGTLTLNNGTIKASCPDDDTVFSFIYNVPTTALSLPDSYYWRTAADGAFTKKTADASYTPRSTDTYLEITTNGVEYMDWNSTTGALEKKVRVNPIPVTGSMKELGKYGQTTWYVVKEDVTINGERDFVDGTVHLILCDGATLTVSGSIWIGEGTKQGASLTIYGQSGQTGALNCDDMQIRTGTSRAGRMTINGGSVNVAGGMTIKGNSMNSGAALTVNGGSLSVTNSSGDGIWIDGQTSGSPGTMTIHGGTVIAESTLDGRKAINCNKGLSKAGILNLPDAYYWRTAADGNYKTQASYTDSDLEGMYFELTTTKPASNIEPTVTGATATVTYGDTPNGSVITASTSPAGTFAWKDDVTGYGPVGTKTLMATFTPNDISYAAVDVEVSVTVEPKTIGIDWTDTELTHNGKPQKPTATATGLVTGDKCTITVTGEQTEAGSYTATAAGLDNPNYKLPENVTCAFTIKAAPTTADGKGKAPQTGDAGVALYVISALGSMSGLVWLGRKKKR